ncbi:response regulator [Persicimonas caeni]|uniref:Response regulator n=1 Tax=Persicimonas caeni TaxID=2292766 RepID=A0A4Y6PX96_PERCE|nr:response regulator [Persicimonas caeni]QDG52375.1 response regulator [Persicimonas caeni]QED33597.1 response regulator [Persicimonas caeni]
MDQLEGHLLVVDDKEMNRDLLARRLRRRGFEVSTAVDGFDALEKMEQQDFDLILLDIMMPRMNGLEVLEKVRQTTSVTELPIIMATAKSDSETVVEALQMGANDYVTKPLDFGVVMARVKTHLDIRNKSKQKSENQRGFAALSDSGKFQAVSSRHYCKRCRSSTQAEQSECPSCYSKRPEGGWPTIRKDKFPHLGRTIADRYFLSRYISSGSVGTVYQARDLEINRDYAAKVVDLSNPGIGVDPEEIRERTTREVEVLSKLSNPHIVKIYDVVIVGDGIFALILDYVRGYSMSKILARAGSFSVINALNIARQVAQGLYEAHQMGIAHCDIKPENIMVEKMPIRGHFAHILDFGVAEILEFRTEGGRYYGTPLYSAPEQFQSPDLIDHRTDIYSLGAVLYHMITGKPPFNGENAYQVLTKHISEPIPRIFSPELDEMEREFLDRLIRRMMAKKPEDRFKDLSGVLEYIDTLLPVFQQRLRERETG